MVNQEIINELVNTNGDVLTTITMSTHKKGEESKQDPIRFKNLINRAEKNLRERGLKDSKIEAYLGEAKKLLDESMFWSHLEEGLAVYVSEEKTDIYKLPYKLDEQIYINEHFLVTPLLPMQSLDGTFAVLAVSRQESKLLKCTRNSVEDITPDNISVSVEDYLEVDPEKQLQFHSGSAGQKAMYFGHNANEEDKMIVVEQFFRELEKEITKELRKRNDPLVMIGLNDNISLYSKINDYSRTVDEPVLFNPDELSQAEVKDKGWDIIKKHFLKEMYSSIEKFSENGESKVSNNLSDIAQATFMGRTQTVFISKDEKKWGFYDVDNQTVQYSNIPNNGDVELLNWLSITAHKNGSKVYILPKEEMPMRSMVAAAFRF